MNFSEILPILKDGACCARTSSDFWRDKYIVMQIPAKISKDIVPRMTSLTDSAKMRIGTIGGGEIHYENQVLLLQYKDDGATPTRATYYQPTWDDILAEDWVAI